MCKKKVGVVMLVLGLLILALAADANAAAAIIGGLAGMLFLGGYALIYVAGRESNGS